MKKVLLAIASLCVSVMLQAQVSKTVNLTNSGMLNTVLTTAELGSVTNLTLSGTIDARDFKTMRDSMPNLTSVDLSNVVVAAYTGTLGTQDSSSDSYLANAIPQYAFYNGTTSKTSLTSVLLPSSVTSIGDYAFYACTGLTSVTIPSLVTSIGDYAFLECVSLTSVSIPSSVTSIGESAFELCVGLTSVSIPSSVTSIGWAAFIDCSGLKSITAYSNIPVDLSANLYVFGNVDTTNCILIVPYGSKAAYAVANQWSAFTNIVEMGTTTTTTYSTFTASACGSYSLNGSTYNQTGIYTQTLINVAGGDSILTLNLTINQTPTVTIAAPAQMCLGNSFLIPATAVGGTVPYTYNWSPTTNFNTGSTSSATFTPTSSGVTSISCLVTDLNGCTAQATSKITVSPLPSITISPSSAAVCMGNSITLSVAGASSYHWNTNDTASKITKTPTATTIYSVTGTNSMGCSTTASATVTFNPIPAVTITAAKSTICSGQQAALTPSGASTYKWNDGQTSATTIYYSPTATTTYFVTGTNAAGCVGTASITISIDKPVITVTASPDSIASGGTTVLTASGGKSYSWANSLGSANPLTVTPTASIDYSVQGTDANGCTGNGSAIVIVNGKPFIVITSISEDDTTVVVNSSIQLHPNILPANASNKTLTWSVDNNGIASVTNTGVVTGILAGNSTIVRYSSTDGSNISGSLKITVVATATQVTAISLSPTSSSLTVGSSVTITPTITPTNATNPTVSWLTSDAKIASVSNGVVTAISVGTATITCFSVQDTSISANAAIVVLSDSTGGTTIPVSEITISTTSSTVPVGSTISLIASVLPSTATNPSVIWTSSENAVATVDSLGLVKGLVPGLVTITATSVSNPSVSNSITIVVSNQTTGTTITGITINPTSVTLPIISKATLTASITPAGATNTGFIWTSSNPAVAIVDTMGNVTTINAGTATISVSPESNAALSAICLLTVTSGTTSGTISFLPAPVTSMIVGSSQTINAVVTTTSGSSTSVIWKSSDSTIVSVTNGVINALKVGNVSIACYSSQDPTIISTFTISVQSQTTDSTITGIIISPANITIPINSKATLIASIIPAGATNTGFIWTSSNPAVASVDTMGNVTTINAGTATISVSPKSNAALSAICLVTVTSGTTIPITAILLKPAASDTITVGATLTIVPTITPTNATNQTVIWSTSDSTIAKVSNGIVTGIRAGTAKITCSSLDKTVTNSITVFVNNATTTIPITAITLKPSASDTIIVGATLTIVSTVTPTNATNQTVIWSTSDSTIAKVTNGIVTGVKAGTAKITCSSQDKTVTNSITVFVNNATTTIPITAITLKPTASDTITVGATLTIVPTITPTNATNQTVIWSTSDSTVAKVSNGIVTGIKAGSAKISCSSPDKTVTNSITVFVTNATTTIPITAITLKPSASDTIIVGATLTIVPTVTPTNATNQTVIWSTSDSTVAKVSNGIVTGVKAGTVKISCSSPDKTVTNSITVWVNNVTTVIHVTGITLKASASDTIKVGSTVTFTPSVMPTNATNSTVKWTTSDSTIAKVSKGIVTGIKAGMVKITCTSVQDTNIKVTTYVFVINTNIAVTAITITGSSTMTVGGSESLATTVTPSNATNVALTWSSSSSTVATVSSAGVVTALAAGTVTITATSVQNPTVTKAITIVVTNVMPTAITISGTLSVPVNSATVLTATVTPINAANVTVSWTSSNTAVATVDATGKVTGVSAGTASITATSNAVSTVKATAVVTVTGQATTVIPVQKMSILNGNQNLQLGQSFTFQAQITPANATSQQYIWYYVNALDTSNHAVLSNNQGSVYTYTPTQAGIFFLFAFSSQYYTTTAGKQIYYHDSVKVTVTQHVPVSGISVNIDSLNVTVGKTDNTAVATISPSNAANKAVRWISVNPAIAQIDSVSGAITGISVGVAKINVYSLDNAKISASIMVNVVAPPVDKSALQTVIQYADNVIANITATQLGTAAGQYSSALMDSLKAQDTKSKIVYNSAVTQNLVDASSINLKLAISNFLNSLVNAVNITSITLNTTSLNLNLSSTSQSLLSATILPTNASNKALNWQSSNTSVVKVDNTGIVYPVGGGTATITATATDGSGKSASCTVTVTIPVSAISIPQTLGLQVGATAGISAVIIPSTATNANILWSSSDTTVAKVDANGIVTAINTGSAKIVAQSVDGQKTAVCIANISAKVVPMTAILLPDTMKIIVGSTKQIQATIKPFNATNQTIIWQSSNIASLTVTYQGVLQALSVDTVTIYAFSQDKSLIDSTIVYVIPSLPPTVAPVAPITVQTGTKAITVALSSLISDSTTNLSNLTFVPSGTANFTVAVVGDSLVITPNNPQTPVTGTITIVVSNQNNQSSNVLIPVAVSSVPNTAPVLSAIPSQTIIKGGIFMPIALPEYVTDDYTKPADIAWKEATGTQLQASISFGILTVAPADSSWIGTDSLLLTAIDQSDLSDSMYVVFSVSNKPNTAPVISQIPVQQQTGTTPFQPIVLSKYVTDDYTPSSYITWTASISSKLSITISGGKAYASVIDANWTGAEIIIFTATDQGGLTSQIKVIYNQTAPITQVTWTGKPVVSFIAERTVVGVNSPVYFHGSITGDYSLGDVWTFTGGNPNQLNDLNPVVTYAKPGNYDVLFVAQNAMGIDSSVINGYISVIGITTPDTTICKGTGITLSVSNPSLTKYIWSNGATTSSISVTPTIKTKYTVTAQYGLFTYLDTVTVSVSKPVSLGNDTAICQGSTLPLTLNGYNSYQWNNNSLLNTNTFTVSSAQKMIIQTKDAFGCVSKDSMNVSVNPLPTVSLGTNDSICPSVTKVLDAGAGFVAYNWSDGVSAEKETVTKSATYSVTVTDKNGCINSSSVVYVVKQPYTDSLGVASVAGTNKIVIAWTRTSGKNSALYAVLRETSVANVYAKEGSTLFTDTSYVVDNSVNTLQQAYKYKLATIDNCNDTAYSPYHETMLLSASVSTNKGNNLLWNEYIGIPLSTYNIYRNDTIIHSIAASSSNGTYTFNDTDGKLGDVYQIGYALPKVISTSMLKSDSGPFSQSLSNMAESQLTEVATTALDETITLYPNPAGSYFSVTTKENAQVQVYTASGIMVVSTKVVSKEPITINSLPAGLYFVKIITGKTAVTRSLVVE